MKRAKCHPEEKYHCKDMCKRCYNRVYSKKYRQTETRKLWLENYLTPDKKEQFKKYRKEWSEKNRERESKKDALYYQKNKKKLMAQRAKYKAANKEKLAVRRREVVKLWRRTVDGFLFKIYEGMYNRVKGNTHPSKFHLWKGKPILPRETFIEWSKNHPSFLSLFKRWGMSGYDRKLTPSVNRIDSNRGYTLDNIEWITFSQNCALGSQARSFNNRRSIYELLKD